jgi:hypothetical protein
MDTVKQVADEVTKKRKGPDFSNIGPESDDWLHAWRDGMDWVRVEVDYPSLKQNFLSWAKINRPLDEQLHWQSLPVHQYLTIGRMAFLAQHGAAMPDEVTTWLDNKLTELLNVEVEIVDNEDEDKKLTLAQKKVLEYATLYSNIEAVWYGNKSDPSEIESRVKNLLQKLQPNQAMLKKLYEHFKDSFDQALKEKDNPLVAETITPILTVVNILATSTGNAKAISESRGATSKHVKQASKAKFKAIDLDTDVASISPAMIPGSKKVLIYNSKSRKISIYAAGPEGLSIKGTKIIGYDDAESFSKILRKPKQYLPTLRDASTIKRADLVMGDYIKGKRHTVNGRLNKDTLVLKVFK